MDTSGLIVSIGSGVVTSLAASVIFAQWQGRRESRRLRAAAGRYVGEWEQQGILNGKPKPFDGTAKCSVKIEQRDAQRGDVIYVTATEAKGDVWEGEAIVNRTVTNRATLVWSYTKPAGLAWFGTYELYLVNNHQILIEPSATTKVGGHEQSVLVRKGQVNGA